MSDAPKIRGKIIMSFPEQGSNFVTYEGILTPKDIRHSRLLTREVFRRFVLEQRKAKIVVLPEPEPVKAPKKSKKKTEKTFVEVIDKS